MQNYICDKLLIITDNALGLFLKITKILSFLPPSSSSGKIFLSWKPRYSTKIAYSPFPMRCRHVQKFAHLFVSPPLHFVEVYARESSILFPPAFILLSNYLSYFGRT